MYAVCTAFHLVKSDLNKKCRNNKFDYCYNHIQMVYFLLLSCKIVACNPIIVIHFTPLGLLKETSRLSETLKKSLK